MPKPQGFIPGQQQSNYKFNEATGWPDEVNNHINTLMKQWHGQPMAYSQHSQDRGNQKNVNIGQLTGGKFPHPENGWRPVEVEHNGKDVTKLVMRGPMSDTHDAVIPVVRNQGGGPFATTAWPNEKTDNHKTLDLNRVHLPEEFKGGKSPKRPLLENWQVKQPGYRPVPADSMGSRQRIIDRFGYGPKPQPQSQPVSAVASFLDYNILRKRLNGPRPIFFQEPF